MVLSHTPPLQPEHNVFILHRGHDAFTHHSIYAQGAYFDITVNSGRRVEFRIVNPSEGATLPDNKIFDCTLLGQTQCTHEQIHQIGSAIAANFGPYSFLRNNCRRFARLLGRAVIRWNKSRAEVKAIRRRSLALFTMSKTVTLTLSDLSHYDRIVASVNWGMPQDASAAALFLHWMWGTGGILGPLSPIIWLELSFVRLFVSGLGMSLQTLVKSRDISLTRFVVVVCCNGRALAVHCIWGTARKVVGSIKEYGGCTPTALWALDWRDDQPSLSYLISRGMDRWLDIESLEKAVYSTLVGPSNTVSYFASSAACNISWPLEGEDADPSV